MIKKRIISYVIDIMIILLSTSLIYSIFNTNPEHYIEIYNDYINTSTDYFNQKLGVKIVKFMRNKCDEYAKEHNLNFTLLATPAEGLSGRFVNIDRAVYGKIKGVTDRAYYTNSFHVPVYYNISIANKIKLEGPYHALTNAGHISYIELDGNVAQNVDAFEKIVRLMKENNFGYGAINHPVDRDPVCGYVGVINDVCPKCGRKAGEGLSVEKLKELGGK